MKDLIILAAEFAFVAAIIAANVALYSRAKRMLRKWAHSNGYHVVASSIRWVRTGPFPAGDRKRIVFRVRTQDAVGNVREGWVSCPVWPFCRVEATIDDGQFSLGAKPN